MSTIVTVTLEPDGCGLELSGSTIYSIGNQYVDASVSPASDPDCGTFSALLNGEAPPIVACDADIISVSLEASDPDCDCELISIECVEAASLFLTSTFTPEGKIKLTLQQSPKLEKIKKLKKIQEIRKRAKEKLIKRRLKS